MESKKINAIVIGATGAVGREIVDLLLGSSNYEKIIIPVRRKINRWENLSPEKQAKLSIVLVENLDFLGSSKEEIIKKLGIDIKIHVLFNALGSRVGRGEEEFVKVDYTYVVNSADVCTKLEIPHFSLCSAMNADTNSWFLYSRTKGKAEDYIVQNGKYGYYSIMRPGIILNRDNDDRFGEKIIAWVPFLPKIESKDIAKAMVVDDINFQTMVNTTAKGTIKFSNDEMLELAKKFS